MWPRAAAASQRAGEPEGSVSRKRLGTDARHVATTAVPTARCPRVATVAGLLVVYATERLVALEKLFSISPALRSDRGS